MEPSSLISIIFLKEKSSIWQICAIILTVGGAVVIGVSDFALESLQNLYGDLFALAGGISGAIYFTIGRKSRERLDIFSSGTIFWPLTALVITKKSIL